jgi:hypothetical protein
MKNILLFSSTIFLVGCLGLTSDSFDKDYYEKTTNISFPDNYKVVATADNGEYLTMTILDLGKTDCNSFIKKYGFRPADATASVLSGLNWLDKKYQTLPDKNLLVKEKSFDNGTGWTYYIDTLNCRLYCQINYPDKEG